MGNGGKWQNKFVGNGEMMAGVSPLAPGRLLPEGRKNVDGLLGDAHDATYGLIVHTHFVEDEEEGVISPFL